MGRAWDEGPARGPWKIRWRDGQRHPVTGVPIKHSSEVLHTRADVETALERKNAELAKLKEQRPRKRGVLPIAIDLLLKTWAEYHLNSQEIQEPYALEVTGILKAIAKDREWSTIADITAASVEAWRATKKDWRGTDKPVAMIQRLLRWAEGPPLKERIDRDVLLLPKRKPKPAAQPPLLTADQLAAIIRRAHTFGDHVGLAIEHLARYGCRQNELCQMKVGDWNSARREITIRKTKNRDPVTHEVDAAYAARIDRITRGRHSDEALFLSPHGEGWKANKRGKYQQLVDWYWSNITLNLEILGPKQRSIGLLKDYAITAMENMGIPDRDKALFTAHRTMGVYNRYKATNRQRVAAASELIGKSAPIGGQIRGQKGRTGAQAGAGRRADANAKRGKSRKKQTGTHTHQPA